MARAEVIIDEAAIAEWTRDSPSLAAALDRITARAVVTMKAMIPVSPVYPVYAQPLPTGSSKGPTYKGRGLARPKGPAVSRHRSAGDLPLAPSGHMRNSVVAVRVAPDEIIIGPTDPAAMFVNDGTSAHEIRSTGPWPLRNRATGQVFGPLVHHPGTKAVHFIERTAATLMGVRADV